MLSNALLRNRDASPPIGPCRAHWPPPAVEFLRCDLCKAVMPEPVSGRDYLEIGNNGQTLIVCRQCTG